MKTYAVYYQLPSLKSSYFEREDLSLDKLSVTHTFVKNVVANSLDEAYVQMQGEKWSPNGEARSLIKSLGLYHTSMSVNDIIFDGESYWQVTNIGFKQLGYGRK